ncbi:MAG: tetratricopeptide repeat protein [Deltaproteobacteria bacterium]|nr:MAG: tetratricopeptide repeat protein [Deltaproteobacteria bacterium]
MRGLAAAVAASFAAGCVSVAEFRQLEREVRELQRAGASEPVDPDMRARIAELSAEDERLQGEIQRLEGRVDVVEHRASQALAVSERVAESADAREDESWVAEAQAAGSELEAEAPPPASAGVSAEITAYREAFESARSGEPEDCIERFREFLQTYGSSNLADDAAYWMADCYFQKGDYRAAVLRFNDVVEGFPKGNKAADALYRQGEALLRMGPGYATAAGTAFERVIEEYPDSERVAEARQQLQVLGSR